MTISELIESLTELAALHGDDAEVRLATQPHYPLQHGVAGVVAQGDNDADIDAAKAAIADGGLDADEQSEARDEIARMTAENQKVVYLLEGSLGYDVNPYASKSLWDEA